MRRHAQRPHRQGRSHAIRKNIAQNTSVASIEAVISKFIQLADAKVHEAQDKADKAVALTDVDDLEASETPESILLGAVRWRPK